VCVCVQWVRVEGGAGRAAQLVAKADLRFVEGAFKLMREQWSYRPALTPQQFLQPVRTRYWTLLGGVWWAWGWGGGLRPQPAHSTAFVRH
jgi:hypothetical protein